MRAQESISEVVTTLRQKGWLDTYAKVEYVTLDGVSWKVDNSMVYPKLETPDGELVPESTYIYFGSNSFSENGYLTPEEALARVANFPTVTEVRNKRLFALVEQATDLASSLQLPVDFINPLTAMAEQLRTNILTAPARNNEEEILF